MGKTKINAFTLIELLAVIVILAIVALIATPIVINIIEDSKKNSFVQTASGIINAGEYYYANQILDGTKLKETKTFEFPNEMVGLEFEGEKPKDGYMLIDNDGKVALAVSNGKYCVTKNYEDIEFQINEDIKGKCAVPYTLLAVATTSKTLGVTEVNSCITRGEICSNGTAFVIQVNDEQVYKFFVISDNGKEVELIMDRNLGDVVAWNINTTDNTQGPVTAVNELKTRTGDWSNILEREYIYVDDGGKYSTFTMNMRARMITQTEINKLKAANNNIIPGYLHVNVGVAYWTATATSYHANLAIHIQMYGYLSHTWINKTNGLRPVITISK